MSAFHDLISSIMPRNGSGVPGISSGVCFSYCAANFIDMIWHCSLGVSVLGSNTICINMF